MCVCVVVHLGQNLHSVTYTRFYITIPQYALSIVKRPHRHGIREEQRLTLGLRQGKLHV